MPDPDAISGLDVAPRTAAVLDALTRAYNDGEVDALDAVLAPTFERHGHSATLDADALKQDIATMRRAFPDLTMQIIRVVEGSDDVALWWHSEGTLSDEYLGLPATGRTYAVSGVTFSTFEGDRIARESVLYDHRGEQFSLGVPLRGGRDASHRADEQPVAPDALRAVHRTMVTGVTVVTATEADGEPRGLAVNAFASVSLEPPLILVCVQKTSSTYRHLIAARHFGVNILAADQTAVARVFATKQDRKFDRIGWHLGDLGTPLLDGAAASMEVETQDILHAQTHTIFIGRVRRVTPNDAPALVYADGAFFDGGRLIAAPEPDA